MKICVSFQYGPDRDMAFEKLQKHSKAAKQSMVPYQLKTYTNEEWDR